MKKELVIFGVIAGLLLLSLVGNSQDKEYNIKLHINGVSESTIILGHYFGKSMYPDDTATIDKQGIGIFEGSEKLKQGMYVVYMEDGSFFQVMMGNDQEFSISTDTSDYVKNLKFEGSEDNIIFSDFQNFMLERNNEMIALQEDLKASDNEKEKKKLQDKVEKLGSERKSRITSISEEHPDLFVTAFLKATLDVDVPEDIQEDASLRYQYYKTHYFDNFDLSDLRLLYTPLYEDKMNYYLDRVAIQIPDSINKEVDMFIEKSRSDSALFRFVLISLFNKYGKSKIMGMDAVQVHIAENYYIPDSWWSDKKFISDLEERVKILKPLLLGTVAPDVQLRMVPADHFKAAANDTILKPYPHAGSFFNISDIDADFTVLLFWEANCSHCKHVVPEVYKIYTDTLKAMNVEVVAISTLFGEDGKEKWIDFVNSKEVYDWVNAWNPYDYKYKEVYDIRSTPQIFVLNKEKEIIGKKLGPENLLELINAYKKYNDK